MQKFLKRLLIKHSKKQGFSLIELIIVVVIIGILASISVSNLGDNTESAKIATAKTEIRSLVEAIQLYSAQTNTPLKNLPKTGDELCTLLKKKGQDSNKNDVGPWMTSCNSNGPWGNEYSLAYDSDKNIITISTTDNNSKTLSSDALNEGLK